MKTLLPCSCTVLWTQVLFNPKINQVFELKYLDNVLYYFKSILLNKHHKSILEHHQDISSKKSSTMPYLSGCWMGISSK